MIGIKVKVIKPVVFCGKTGRHAVPEGAVGTIQGTVPVGSQQGVAVLFPEVLEDGSVSEVLDNGHIKQWSFLPHELEVVDTVVPNSRPIYAEEDVDDDVDSEVAE